MKHAKNLSGVVAYPLREPEARPPLEYRATGTIPPTDWTFAELLAPVGVQRFCENYWGKYPVLIRKGLPGYFSSLTSVAEIESYLSLSGVFEDQTVVLRSRELPMRRRFDSVAEMYAQMARGSSLQLREMERFLAPNSPLRRLNQDLIGALQHPGNSISCFITPPDCELLGPHHDETEIFTLQISGSKRWKLFHRVCADGPGTYGADDLGPPVAEFSLGPGDVLYHPRGQVHEVVSEDSTSFSVAIVVTPLTWRLLLDTIVKELANEPEFVEQLPAGLLLDPDAASRVSEAVRTRLSQMAEQLRGFDSHHFIDRVAEEFLLNLAPPPRTQLEAILTGVELTPETRVVPPPGLLYRVYEKQGSARLAIAGGDVIIAPQRVAAILRDVMDRTAPVSINALHDALSDRSKLVLARKLVAGGALSVTYDPA